MFSIFQRDTLIGRSRLEAGDPPMGVASGQFEPTEAFVALRNTMMAARDAAGREIHDMRFLSGLSAKTEGGTPLVCANVEVFEYGAPDYPFAYEVFCLAIAQPPYEELFPHHVTAYRDQFKR